MIKKKVKSNAFLLLADANLEYLFRVISGGAAVGAGCGACGGRGGFTSPVTTAPLAASGARGSGGLINAAGPSWCLYCGCSQPLPPNGQCLSCSPHRRAVQTLQRPAPSSEPHRRGYFEAEDAAFSDASARHRSGQYYSPPGTSYTIVEARPSARDLPLREIGFRLVLPCLKFNTQK
jgi:hypothetical protein